MSRDEKEAYWADFRIVGNLFGLADAEMPADLAELDDYRRDRYASGELIVTDWARRDREARSSWTRPFRSQPAPCSRRRTSSRSRSCPGSIREQYGFSSLPPGPVRELAVGAYAEYVKRGVLPFVPRRLRRIPVARAA